MIKTESHDEAAQFNRGLLSPYFGGSVIADRINGGLKFSFIGTSTDNPNGIKLSIVSFAYIDLYRLKRWTVMVLTSDGGSINYLNTGDNATFNYNNNSYEVVIKVTTSLYQFGFAIYL